MRRAICETLKAQALFANVHAKKAALSGATSKPTTVSADVLMSAVTTENPSRLLPPSARGEFLQRVV